MAGALNFRIAVEQGHARTGLTQVGRSSIKALGCTVVRLGSGVAILHHEIWRKMNLNGSVRTGGGHAPGKLKRLEICAVLEINDACHGGAVRGVHVNGGIRRVFYGCSGKGKVTISNGDGGPG